MKVLTELIQPSHRGGIAPVIALELRPAAQKASIQNSAWAAVQAPQPQGSKVDPAERQRNMGSRGQATHTRKAVILNTSYLKLLPPIAYGANP
jgi:hypothetical protein